MRKRSLSLALLTLLVMILMHIKVIPEEKIIHVLPSDPESALARGQTISIAELDQFSLELIPGIGPQLAQNILTRRNAFRDKTKLCPALLLVKGIGESRCQVLARYLKP